MSFENESNSSVDSESGRKKYRAVIADVDIESQARDVAESRLLSSKEELKGFKGFFRKIWKHNLAHEYYRQKEIAKAKREIKESGNLYIGEDGEKRDHEIAMEAIMHRFQSEYEGENLLRKGEEKRTLQEKQPEDLDLKNGIQDLIKRFATGKINEEQFGLEKNKLFENIQPKPKNASVHADNLLEIAKQVKDSIAHGKGIDSLDDDFEIIIGRARAGVETEASYNAVDRMLKKMKSNSVGKYVSRFVNETTMASAVAIAYGVIAKGAIGAAQRGARMVGPLGMGLSAGVGGAVAGLRENKRLKEERAQHMREMAKGGEMEANSKRREEMEKFRYETKNASELSKNLSEALEELKTQPSEQKLHAVLEKLNEINSRLSFSEREKIDLIDFSDSKNVEKERTDMYITAAEAKVFLKKNIHANWATFYNNEDQLDEYLQHIKDVKIQKDFLEEKTVKDAAFNKMKRKKVAWSVTKGLGIGLGVGVVAQEIGAYMEGGKEGIFEEATSGTKEHHYTSLEYLRRYISGELPKDELYSAPSGPSEVIHKETSSHEAIVGTKDYIKEHENIFTKIKRGVWADNETLKPDKNELKVWWGGEKGTGIDENGNYVFSVKHMVKGGSFHGGKHFDPQELMKEGKMKLLISLSGDTQNQVVEIPIDANGNAVIDPNSEIGKIAFNNAGGHANFLGKFAEVAVLEKNADGVDEVSVLATHVGKEIESVKTLIAEEKNIREMMTSGLKSFSRPVDYDVELPFVIPIMGRRPMEQLKNGESAAKVLGTDLEEVEIQQEEPVEKEEEKVIVDDDDAAKKAAIAAAAVAATAASAAIAPNVPPVQPHAQPSSPSQVSQAQKIPSRHVVVNRLSKLAQHEQDIQKKMGVVSADTHGNISGFEKAKLSKAFSDSELSLGMIKDDARNAGKSVFELSFEFIKGNPELLSQFEKMLNTIPDHEQTDRILEKLALETILEHQCEKLREKIKREGETDVLKALLRERRADLLDVKTLLVKKPIKTPTQPSSVTGLNQSPTTPPVTPNAPPSSKPNIPPSPEKLDADQLREAAGQIKTQFNIYVQTDSIAGEDNNKEIMENLQKALTKINKEKLSNIKTIGLLQNVSRVLSGEGAVALAYTLSPEEMAIKINELLGEMDRKKAEIFESNQFVKEVRAKSPELLNNLKRQMEEQKVPIEAQLNFLEIVAGAELTRNMVEKLSLIKLKFVFISGANLPREIGEIHKISGILTVSVGSYGGNAQNKEKLAKMLNIYMLRF